MYGREMCPNGQHVNGNEHDNGQQRDNGQHDNGNQHDKGRVSKQPDLLHERLCFGESNHSEHVPWSAVCNPSDMLHEQRHWPILWDDNEQLDNGQLDNDQLDNGQLDNSK